MDWNTCSGPYLMYSYAARWPEITCIGIICLGHVQWVILLPLSCLPLLHCLDLIAFSLLYWDLLHARIPSNAYTFLCLRQHG